MDKASIAWAAGVFEGEGWMAYREKPASWQASVTMTDEDVVLRFAAVVGVGRVRGPIKKQRAHYKDQWQWCVSSRADVVLFLEMVLPWLGERRCARALAVLAQTPKRERSYSWQRYGKAVRDLAPHELREYNRWSKARHRERHLRRAA
jgi:hypothetical protein